MGKQEKAVPRPGGGESCPPLKVKPKAVIQLNSISMMGYRCAEVYYPAQKRVTSLSRETQRPNKGE